MPHSSHHPQFPSRPQRFRMPDTLGRMQTLAQGAAAYVRLRPGARGEGVLLLGLGPDARELAALLPPSADVLWVECPDFAATMDRRDQNDRTLAWRANIPASWQEIPWQEAVAVAASEAPQREIWAYRQNARLFPQFWGPVLGAVEASLLDVDLIRVPVSPVTTRTVLLPGGEQDLLHRELVQAFADVGLTVRELRQDKAPQVNHSALRRMLTEHRPSLFFSVNLRGLDAGGAAFELLRACGVPVGLWFVDNPWQILSALRQPWWQAAHIYVTDASFMEGLRSAGARHVRHLPLAACPDMERATALHTGLPIAETRMLFVGRAAFPAQAQFFAAARVDATDRKVALALLEDDASPDFHWWAHRQSLPLWPGHGVRAVGLGAETCAIAQRVRWLRAALPCGLAVYGDAARWRSLLQEAPEDTFQPAVDYYTVLPGLYAAAPYTLNVTSLLLPAGLTQRHFDVWAAGGVLLTDASPGLDIFPPELVREVALSRAGDIPAAVERLENDAPLRRDLAAAWKQHISVFHSYRQRVAAVAESLSL